MHTRVALAVLVTLLSLGLPAVAPAQDRKGFWIGTDISLRAAGARFEGFDFERWSYLGIAVDLGWTLQPQVLVGIEPRGLSIFLISRNGDRADSAIVDLPTRTSLACFQNRSIRQAGPFSATTRRPSVTSA